MKTVVHRYVVIWSTGTNKQQRNKQAIDWKYRNRQRQKKGQTRRHRQREKERERERGGGGGGGAQREREAYVCSKAAGMRKPLAMAESAWRLMLIGCHYRLLSACTCIIIFIMMGFNFSLSAFASWISYHWHKTNREKKMIHTKFGLNVTSWQIHTWKLFTIVELEPAIVKNSIFQNLSMYVFIFDQSVDPILEAAGPYGRPFLWQCWPWESCRAVGRLFSTQPASIWPWGSVLCLLLLVLLSCVSPFFLIVFFSFFFVSFSFFVFFSSLSVACSSLPPPPPHSSSSSSSSLGWSSSFSFSSSTPSSSSLSSSPVSSSHSSTSSTVSLLLCLLFLLRLHLLLLLLLFFVFFFFLHLFLYRVKALTFGCTRLGMSSSVAWWYSICQERERSEDCSSSFLAGLYLWLDSFLMVTGNLSVIIGTLLYVFGLCDCLFVGCLTSQGQRGLCEHHSEPTKEMCIPLRPIPKGDTL